MAPAAKLAMFFAAAESRDCAPKIRAAETTSLTMRAALLEGWALRKPGAKSSALGLVWGFKLPPTLVTAGLAGVVSCATELLPGILLAAVAGAGCAAVALAGAAGRNPTEPGAPGAGLAILGAAGCVLGLMPTLPGAGLAAKVVADGAGAGAAGFKPTEPGAAGAAAAGFAGIVKVAGVAPAGAGAAGFKPTEPGAGVMAGAEVAEVAGVAPAGAAVAGFGAGAGGGVVIAGAGFGDSPPDAGCADSRFGGCAPVVADWAGVLCSAGLLSSAFCALA